MTEKEAKLEALKYAIYVCDTHRLPFKKDGYIVACDEIKLSLQAAMERVEGGEDMYSYAHVPEV